MSGGKIVCFICILFTILAFISPVCFDSWAAAGDTKIAGQTTTVPQGETTPQASAEQDLNQYDLGEIENYLSGMKDSLGYEISFSDLIKNLMAGKFMDVASDMLGGIKSSLLSEIKFNSALMAQIIVLGIIGAVFTNFSSVFTGSQISETGFFVTYLLLFTFLATSFFSSIEVAERVLNQILGFMKVLLPSYFLAVAFAGGSISSFASYEFTLFTISLVQWLFFRLLIPFVRVYVLLVLAGHIAKEDILSKLTELIKTGIEWTLKTLLGVVLGFQLIQGMVLPYVDSMKNTSVQKFLQVIPGVGQGVNAVAQVILGSGVLIKNTMGAAAVFLLIFMALIPVLKLLVLMALYQCGAAVLQPVCDKRIVSCISAVAQGHKLLLSIVMSALLLFVVTIAIVCGATNVTYYAG